MVCKITSTSPGRHTRARRRGLTLVEMLVSMGIAGIVFAAVAQMLFFSGRNMASLYNYVDLDYRSNHGLKIMSKEIREASLVTAATSYSISLQDSDGLPLSYAWNSGTKSLTRTKNGTTDKLLMDCDSLTFSIFQRNPVNGAFDQYPVAVATNAKVVQVSWICSRKVLGTLINSESVQSAKFVIRKQ